jgi:UDP-N-acetylmuramoyl-tripeptide--D-alanyl-D-alanine ligase
MFNSSEIVKVTHAKVSHPHLAVSIKGVSIDSRTVRAGDLFIAVKGQRYDGHDFIPAVVRRGVAAVMVSRKTPPLSRPVPVFYVRDTIKALGQIANLHRQQFPIPVIAITGSAGKTTTKELIAAVLQRELKVLKNVGTQNNFIGVPLTLLKLNKGYQVVVVELGTNRFGDIPWLAQVVNPDIAVLTTIGESHLELLKTPALVFREKSALIRDMKARGLVIYNNDNPHLSRLPRLFPDRRFFSVGIQNTSDFQAKDVRILDNESLQFKLNDRHIVKLNSPVQENISNALIAISCGRVFGMHYNKIIEQLKKFHFEGNRQRVYNIKGRWIIDDSYNANPVSFRSALRTLNNLKVKGLRILVCSDMKELGLRAKELHREIGRLVSGGSVQVVLSYGTLSQELSSAAQRERPNIIAWHFKNKPDLHQALLKFSSHGNAFLVKGSRTMKMEETVAFLKDHFK